MRYRTFGKTCARCKRIFNADMVLQCHHPVVQEVFGDDMCLYCCKHCRHHMTDPLIDGVICGFKEGEQLV